MADVTLTYKGQTILELSASGNKDIKTSGKYCEADIGLAYIKTGSSYTVLKGTTQPTAAIGQDGDVYLQYASVDGEIENTYVKVSGAWQALVGSDVDDVSNSGMYTGTEAPPPASLGTDGDYYYQRTDLFHSIDSMNESAISGSTSKEYGTAFAVTEQVTVKSLFAMTTEANTGKLQFGTTGQILAEIENVTFPAGEWVEVPLTSPIQLSPNTIYLVKAAIAAPNYGRIAILRSRSDLSYNNAVSYDLSLIHI